MASEKVEVKVVVDEKQAVKSAEALEKAVANTTSALTTLNMNIRTVNGMVNNMASNMQGLHSADSAATESFGSINQQLGDMLSPLSSAASATSTLAEGMNLAGLASLASGANMALAAVSVGGLILSLIGLGVQHLKTKSELDIIREGIQENIDKWNEIKQTQQQYTESGLENIAFYETLWGQLQALANEQGVISEADQSRAEFLADQLNPVLGETIQKNKDGTISLIENSEAVDQMIEKQKAQIILDSQEQAYREAILKMADAENLSAELSIQMKEKEQALSQAQIELDQAEATGNQGLIEQKMAAYSVAMSQFENTKKAYEENEELLSGYYQTTSEYESLATAISTGNHEQMQAAINGTGSAYQNATGQTKEELDQQVRLAEENLALMKQRYEEGTAGVTQQMVEDAAKQVETARTNASKVGEELSNGVASGVESQGASVSTNMSTMIKNAIAAAKKAAGIASPSKEMAKIGAWMDDGLEKGIREKTESTIRGTTDMIRSLLAKSKAVIDRENRETGLLKAMTDVYRYSQESYGESHGNITQTINFNQPVQTPAQMARALRRESKQLARGVY